MILYLEFAIDLTFQEKKKQFVTPFFGYRDSNQTRWLIFLIHPVVSRKHIETAPAIHALHSKLLHSVVNNSFIFPC